MRVAVVEDSIDVADMLRLVLETAGVDTVVFTTGFESLLTAEPWRGVDAAVIDLMLPEVSGEAIVGYLADNHPGVRRVVLSAVAHQRPGLDRLATLITKPVSPNVLLAALGVRDDD